MSDSYENYVKKSVDDYSKAIDWFKEFRESTKDILKNDNSELLLNKLTATFITNDTERYIHYSADAISNHVAPRANEIKEELGRLAASSAGARHYDLFLISLAYIYEYFYLYATDNQGKPYDFIIAAMYFKNYLSNLRENALLDSWTDTFDGLFESCVKAQHILFEKKSHLLREDVYGFVDPTPWEAEKEAFAEKVVKFGMKSDPSELTGFALLRLLRFHIIDAYLHKNGALGVASQSTQSPLAPIQTGIAYENRCIDMLLRHGWAASDTPQACDRGADIIASKRGIRVVFQCKHWESKVTSTAIQEVVTAKEYFDATFAVLLCENGCTPQAQEMADRLKVVVCTHEDLPEIEMILVKKLIQT